MMLPYDSNLMKSCQIIRNSLLMCLNNQEFVNFLHFFIMCDKLINNGFTLLRLTKLLKILKYLPKLNSNISITDDNV